MTKFAKLKFLKFVSIWRNVWVSTKCGSSRESLHQDSVSKKCCDTSKMCSAPDLADDGFQFGLILLGTKILKWFNFWMVPRPNNNKGSWAFKSGC